MLTALTPQTDEDDGRRLDIPRCPQLRALTVYVLEGYSRTAQEVVKALDRCVKTRADADVPLEELNLSVSDRLWVDEFTRETEEATAELLLSMKDAVPTFHYQFGQKH